jgi:hypothetical protein
MGGYTRAGSGQRLGKHVSAATNRHAIIEVMLEGRQLVRPCQFCKGVCEEWTCVDEAEESPLLKFVTRKRLVKTLQTGEDLACCDL